MTSSEEAPYRRQRECAIVPFGDWKGFAFRFPSAVRRTAQAWRGLRQPRCLEASQIRRIWKHRRCLSECLRHSCHRHGSASHSPPLGGWGANAPAHDTAPFKGQDGAVAPSSCIRKTGMLRIRTSARARRLSPACPGGHRLPSAVGKLELASDARRASGERPVFREPLKGSGRSENDTGGSATAKLWVAAPFQGGVSLTEASY